MKIVSIITRLNVGGAAIQAILPARTLRDAGHEVILVAGSVPAGEGDMGYFAEAIGVQPVYLRSMSRRVAPFDDLRAFIALVRLLRRHRPDLVHTHTAKAGSLGRIAAWLTRIPRVHTFHGNVFRGYFSRRGTRLVVGIERALARLTDRIVVVSDAQRQEIAGEFAIAPPRKVQVVRYGFDLRELARVAAARSYAPRPDFQIGWVGRLTPIKDPLLCIDIAAACYHQLELHWSLVGDGELRPQVESAIRERGLNEVALLGWQRDMAALQSRLDVLLLTSRNEGTPVAIIEAMAAGTCVVAANVGGVPDLFAAETESVDGYRIHANGILVDGRDPDAFARAITRLRADPALRRRLGASAAQFAAEQYGAERLSAELLALYESVLAARGRAPQPAARARAAAS